MVIEQDTIAAIATALGEAGVGIIRVSGLGSKAVAECVFRRPSGAAIRLSAKRTMVYGHVVNPTDNATIDEGLLLWMPGPKSYTAEDVVELHVHGGIQVVQAALSLVLANGARLAEPGEFTKRAFLNGRLDLSQAEAVIDLIRSKTELSSRAALRQVQGHLGNKVRVLRKTLIGLQAHVEVTIDYPEHDVEDVVAEQVVSVATGIVDEIDVLLASAHYGKILRDGVATAIVGRPNVGKSSLLNALLRRDRAIVTDVPGTTRDVLEEYVNLQGIPFRLIDTAGIRETSDVVEKIGVERSLDAILEAELVVVVLNGSEPLTEADIAILERTSRLPRVIVLNKSDLPQTIDSADLNRLLSGSEIVQLSAKQGIHIDTLERAMASLAFGGEVKTADVSYLTNARQARLFQDAKTDLQSAIDAARSGVTLDLVAVTLQSAYATLGLVIGEEAGEDLLDEIFTQFCLGK